MTDSAFGHFTCIKSFDGMPLFSRTIHGCKPLPAQIISILNGVFTYVDNYGFRIHSVDSKNFKIVWKMYNSNITLILVEQLAPVDDQVYFRKLDLLFDAMVLMYGIEDLVNVKNVEKFKKEIRVAYNLIDVILDNSGKFDLFGGYLTNFVDLILVNDVFPFQAALDASCVAINTSYSCLIINGRIITASNSWWELKPTEAYLVSLLCLTLNDSNTCRDIPIYLPHKNPHQPLRLLTYNLCSNIILCFICSEKPTVDSVEPKIKNIWHPIYKLLISLKQYLPRNLPTSITLDQNMIGFLLINKKTKCCTSSLCPNDKVADNIPAKEAKSRYELLKYCYLNISTNYFNKSSKNGSTELNDADDADDLTSSPEAYLLYSGIKCYALNDSSYEFYAIFNKNIPTYAIRGVTKACFNVLMTGQTPTPN